MAGNFYGGGNGGTVAATNLPLQTHRPTVTDGQLLFTLPTTPANPASLEMKVNGVVHSPIESPSVLTTSGTTVIWTNVLHALSSTDEVWFTYF